MLLIIVYGPIYTQTFFIYGMTIFPGITYLLRGLWNTITELLILVDWVMPS